MKGLLKGDRQEQTGLRKSEQEKLSWEQIIAAVNQLWGGDWETLKAGYGNRALAAALYLGRTIQTRRCESWAN